MHCPKCSQHQIADKTQFCSRCGLPLYNLKEKVLAWGNAQTGQSKVREDEPSPRQKGIRQGIMLMLLSIILIPAYILLAALFPANDHLVESSVSDTPFEKMSQAVLFTLFALGLTRLVYARLFEQGGRLMEGERKGRLSQLMGSTSDKELPPAQDIPISGFGSWQIETGELALAHNSREHTTKSLDEQ